MENECAETPLIELLRDVPKDARLEIEVNPTHHKMIPVGVHCHNAAEKLTEARKNLDGWMSRAEVAETKVKALREELERVKGALEGVEGSLTTARGALCRIFNRTDATDDIVDLAHDAYMASAKPAREGATHYAAVNGGEAKPLPAPRAEGKGESNGR